jgi:hypothetical protein
MGQSCRLDYGPVVEFAPVLDKVDQGFIVIIPGGELTQRHFIW